MKFTEKGYRVKRTLIDLIDDSIEIEAWMGHMDYTKYRAHYDTLNDEIKRESRFLSYEEYQAFLYFMAMLAGAHLYYAPTDPAPWPTTKTIMSPNPRRRLVQAAVVRQAPLPCTPFLAAQPHVDTTKQSADRDRLLPCMWFEVDPDAKKIKRTFCLVGTGRAVPLGSRYTGTVFLEDDSFVLHVYEIDPEEYEWPT